MILDYYRLSQGTSLIAAVVPNTASLQSFSELG